MEKKEEKGRVVYLDVFNGHTYFPNIESGFVPNPKDAQEISDIINDKVPIKRGCPNQQCFCTGACEEIIGWRDKFQNEH